MPLQLCRLSPRNCIRNPSISAPMYQCSAMRNFPCCILTRSPYFQMGRLIAGTSVNLRYSSMSQFPLIIRQHMQILSICQGPHCFESGNSCRVNSLANKFILNTRSFSTKKINKFNVKAKGISDVAALEGNYKLEMKPKPNKKRKPAKCDSIDGKLNSNVACPNPNKSSTVSAHGDNSTNIEGKVIEEGSVIKLASKSTKCDQAAGGKASLKKKQKSKNKNQDDVATDKESLTSNSITQKTKLPAKKNRNPASKKKVKEISGSSSSVLEIPADSSNLTEVNNLDSSSGYSHSNVFKPLYPPSGKCVVVVESVTKAKVIQNYLGNMYEVLPSYGHLRDLAGKSGSVKPDDDFSMVWEMSASARTHLKSIKVALKGAENLILASDPDREGEAIAWHIVEMLQQQDALSKHITVARVVFHEITESSIKSALQAPREIDRNLVDAYLARRALDYLIGFNISPLLWRKLPGCSSAGRVQSAALALICDREMEIEQFNKREYWTVGAQFDSTNFNILGGKCSIASHLTHFNSQKMDQLSICSDDEAREIEKMITSSKFKVLATKTSKVVKNPPMPFITSTLQQDAANKLHFPASYTMKLAQKLYEGLKLSGGEATGLITYMRTDGLHVSFEAAEKINSFVKERYGEEFASKTVRKHFKKVKNAQEAHEAIRPTDIRRLPEALADILDDDSLKLYTLIWTRTMACQMEPATIDMVQVDIGNMEGGITFRSVASRLGFPGFQEVYKDRKVDLAGSEDKQRETDEMAFTALHNLKVGDSLSLVKVCLQQHHTKPSPRYSEGALVKKMEELGIGRPSTYASTMKVLQDRKYVTVKSRVLHPEFRGRMLSAFLSHHFSEVADYSFTADMENELDNVSAGETEWKGLIKEYWLRFSKYCGLVRNTEVRQVEGLLEKTFEHYLFSGVDNDTRVCPSCSVGTLRFKVSRFGSGYFIGCDGYPKCMYTAMTSYGEENEDVPSEKLPFEPKYLGDSPNINEKIFLKKGPFGYYVQLGEERKGYKPKRASIREGNDADTITLEDAVELLKYPITLGKHPEDGHPVLLNRSKNGFRVKHNLTTCLVPKDTNLEDVTLDIGVKLLSSKKATKSGRFKNKTKAVKSLKSLMKN